MSSRLVFAVELANFLMFIVSGENTDKFLEGFSCKNRICTL